MKSLEKLAEETFPGGHSCPAKALGTLAVRAKMVKAVRKWMQDNGLPEPFFLSSERKPGEPPIPPPDRYLREGEIPKIKL